MAPPWSDINRPDHHQGNPLVRGLDRSRPALSSSQIQRRSTLSTAFWPDLLLKSNRLSRVSGRMPVATHALRAGPRALTATSYVDPRDAESILK